MKQEKGLTEVEFYRNETIKLLKKVKNPIFIKRIYISVKEYIKLQE